MLAKRRAARAAKRKIPSRETGSTVRDLSVHGTRTPVIRGLKLIGAGNLARGHGAPLKSSEILEAVREKEAQQVVEGDLWRLVLRALVSPPART